MLFCMKVFFFFFLSNGLYLKKKTLTCLSEQQLNTIRRNHKSPVKRIENVQQFLLEEIPVSLSETQ